MAIAASAGTTPALGVPPQWPRYRVTHLRETGGMAAVLALVPHDGTIGINNKGQVVYGYEEDSYRHAWFWTHFTDYGFAPNTIHALDSTEEVSSLARDINESGKIVGYSGDPRAATIWSLASNVATPILLGCTPSEAHALTNDSPPRVVGWRGTNDECSEIITLDKAFLWDSGTSTCDIYTTYPLEPTGTYYDGHSIAFDIQRAADGVTVGRSETCLREGLCYQIFEGCTWNDGYNAQLLELGDIRDDDVLGRQCWPYGVNDDENIVGWVMFDPDDMQAGCDPTAAFWVDRDDMYPVDLSEFLPTPYNTSRAFAINNASPLQVVGMDAQEGEAFLWEFDSSWTALNLNSTGYPDCMISACDAETWVITEAHDINDNGWIVAFGLGDSGSGVEQHVLLLSPVGCPWDVNEDDSIDEYDVAAIIASAGACVPAKICRGDVDFDCDVDRDDGFLLLTYLSECAQDPCPCEFTFEESMAMTQGGGLSAERFTEAIAATPSLTSQAIAQAWSDFLSVYSSNSN